MVTILISASFRGVALIRGEVFIRGRRLFQCRHPKMRHLLEGLLETRIFLEEVRDFKRLQSKFFD